MDQRIQFMVQQHWNKSPTGKGDAILHEDGLISFVLPTLSFLLRFLMLREPEFFLSSKCEVATRLHNSHTLVYACVGLSENNTCQI